MTYLLFITLGLCLTYILSFWFLPILLGKKIKNIGKQSISSIILICVLSIGIYLWTFTFANIELGNRVLHALGGGFTAFMVCFLIVKDSELKINKLQFFVLSFLIVTALGVFNEIIEFVRQNYFGLLAATTINDTWLDLISNLTGSLVAAIIFVPFVNNKKKID